MARERRQGRKHNSVLRSCYFFVPAQALMSTCRCQLATLSFIAYEHFGVPAYNGLERCKAPNLNLNVNVIPEGAPSVPDGSPIRYYQLQQICKVCHAGSFTGIWAR